MALLAAALGLGRPSIVDLVGSEAAADNYSQRDDDNILKALNAWTDSFRSAAIKGGYTAASIDALNSTTCPENVKRWILHGALDEMTSGGMGRPENIGKYGDEARKWLSRLAGGAETIDGLTRGSSTSGPQVRISAPTELTFDRDNVSQNFDYRDPEI